MSEARTGVHLPTEGYDYGFYVKVYPIYNEAHEGATLYTYEYCGWQAIAGEYKLPVLGNVEFDSWNISSENYYFLDEQEIIDVMINNGDN